MDFQQIRDFVNPAVAQATGLQEVDNLQMPVPVAYVPVQIVIDGALSLTSENPVQNKVIAVAIQNLDGRITAVEGQFAEGVTEAVNNWLAAHPEATTTVQDGAITYAKLDANLKGEVDQISELKSALELVNVQADATDKTIYVFSYLASADIVGLDKGAITTTVIGETIAFNTATNMRHYYVNVVPGDVYRVTIRKQATNLLYHIVFTDANDVVVGLHEKGIGAIKNITDVIAIPSGVAKMYVCAQDVSGPANWNPNDRIEKGSKNVVTNNEFQNLRDRIITDERNPFIHQIGEDNIILSALNTETGEIITATSRGVTPNYIPVLSGDAIQRKPGDIGIIIAFYDAQYNFIRVSNASYLYYDRPVYVSDNESFIRISYRKNNDDTPEISDFANVVSVVRMASRTELLTLGILNRVEHSTSSDFVRGYINPTSGAIQTHNYYMATARYFRVKPGDIVRCSNTEMNMWVMEYAQDLTAVRHSEYIRKQNKNPYNAGEWVVKTDGFVRAYFTNYNAQTETDISLYGNALEIVHCIDNLSEQDAVGRKWITAKNYVKPRKIRTGSDIGSQAGFIYDGFLFETTDDYSGNYAIEKIDIANGETVKTYTHDFGHGSCLDYCKETDTLLTTNNGAIILYPNFSQAISGDSFSVNDAIVIQTNLGPDITLCFGEDEMTLYCFKGRDSVGVLWNEAYKIELGYNTNDLSSDGWGTYTANAQYNGTAKLIKTFTGEIRQDADGIFKSRNTPYAQDCKYDGYLYLTYGTDGYNCFAIDLNEKNDTYKVVGNYVWVFRDENYNDQGGEAELLALNGSKIVSVVRDFTNGISCMIEFER